jgi:fibronectin type 3 domain-containing protein
MKNLLIVLLFLFIVSIHLPAQVISHGVILTWSWTGIGTPTYNIYRATTSGGEVKPPLLTGITTSPCNDATAVSGTKYYYTITAVVGGVESAPSSEVSALVVVPNSPTNPSTAVY